MANPTQSTGRFREPFSRPRWALLATLTWFLLIGGVTLATLVCALGEWWGLLGWPMMFAAHELATAWEDGWRP